jgi:hypothetical protein
MRGWNDLSVESEPGPDPDRTHGALFGTDAAAGGPCNRRPANRRSRCSTPSVSPEYA